VTLEEHRAAALWQGEAGNERLVNSHGEVFEANLGDVEDEDLVTLAGPEGSSGQVLAMQRRLADTLAPIDARIETLKLTSRAHGVPSSKAVPSSSSGAATRTRWWHARRASRARCRRATQRLPTPAARGR